MVPLSQQPTQLHSQLLSRLQSQLLSKLQSQLQSQLHSLLHRQHARGDEPHRFAVLARETRELSLITERGLAALRDSRWGCGAFAPKNK